MLEKIKNALGGKNFFYGLIVFFVAQSMWYVFSVRYRIPPDERYHYQFINYYAHQPIANGPVITNQEQFPETFILSDIERTPSYLYHYLMSFPLRLVKKFISTEARQVVILRLINIGFIVVGFFVLYRILALIKLNRLQANLVIFMLTMTGMLTWLSAAINYDNLAFPLFFVSIYSLLKIIEKFRLKYLTIFGIFAISTLLVKVTFAPILFIAFLIASTLSLQHKLPTYQQIKRDFIKNKTLLIVLSVLLLVFSGLFIERIGTNVVRYGSITPACDAIHTQEQCLRNSGYTRGVKQKKIVQELKANNQKLDVMPGEFVSNWLGLMYDRIYFYLGHKQMQPTTPARLASLLMFIFFVILLGLKRNILLKTKQQKFLFLVTVTYIAILFMFNLTSYLRDWAKFGYQGRYLLPVLPFVYAFCILLFWNVYNSCSKYVKRALLLVFALLTTINLYQHAPPLVFLRGSDSTWFTSETIGFNKKLNSMLHKVYLTSESEIKYIDSPD